MRPRAYFPGPAGPCAFFTAVSYGGYASTQRRGVSVCLPGASSPRGGPVTLHRTDRQRGTRRWMEVVLGYASVDGSAFPAMAAVHVAIHVRLGSSLPGHGSQAYDSRATSCGHQQYMKYFAMDWFSVLMAPPEPCAKKKQPETADGGRRGPLAFVSGSLLQVLYQYLPR